MKARLSYGVSATALAAALVFGASGIAYANDDVLALMADPANVVMPSITYNGWNYSTLDQITLANVTDLQVAWTWQVGILDSARGSAARRRRHRCTSPRRSPTTSTRSTSTRTASSSGSSGPT